MSWTKYRSDTRLDSEDEKISPKNSQRQNMDAQSLRPIQVVIKAAHSQQLIQEFQQELRWIRVNIDQLQMTRPQIDIPEDCYNTWTK